MTHVPLPAILGVPLRTSWSWMLVALCLTGISFYQLAPRSNANNQITGWLIGATILTLGCVCSLVVHEIGHIWTARRDGHELSAVEPSLLGALPDTCYVPQSPASEVRVALAGPLVSLLLALVTAAAWWLSGSSEEMPLLALLLLGAFNLGLVALNLLPGYPFDGGRMMRAFIWYVSDDLVRATRIVATYGQVLIFLALLGGVVLLSLGETYSVWGTWILLLCWTIGRARAEGVSQTVWRDAGSQLRIDDLFQAGVNRVQSSMTIDDSIESLLENYRRGPTLVVTGSEVIGIVDLQSIRRVPRASWTQVTVEEVMSDIADLPRLESAASVTDLLAELPSGSATVVLVQRDGRIVAAADRDFVMDRVQSYIRAERINRLRRR